LVQDNDVDKLDNIQEDLSFVLARTNKRHHHQVMSPDVQLTHRPGQTVALDDDHHQDV